MKTLKTLLTASVLTVAGTTGASAATIASFTYVQTAVFAAASISGNGTAVLDDAGTFTFTGDTTTTGFFDAPSAKVNSTTVLEGTITGNSLVWESGLSTLNSCTQIWPPTGNSVCDQAPANAPFTADQQPIVFNLAPGGTTVITTDAADPANTITYTFTTVAAVPVPATIWLFGAGLLGLAGAARRRNG